MEPLKYYGHVTAIDRITIKRNRNHRVTEIYHRVIEIYHRVIEIYQSNRNTS